MRTSNVELPTSNVEVRADVGVVAIGRNEGERLEMCLRSAVAVGVPVVYVDSGSTDGSVGMARAMGASVVELDLGEPFTAARARNEGWRKLVAEWPGVRFVQFVDGDCEFAAGWMERGRAELVADEKLAVVCGRRRERFPERSIYNRLVDVEWDTPVGEATACGGDAMFRVEALVGAGGYDGRLIAGEEPELCARLRKAGWRIRRVDAEMTLHDAAMVRWGQWVRRAVRSGYGEMNLAMVQGRAEPASMRLVRGTMLWAGVLPAAAVGLAWVTRGWSVVGLLGLYLLQFARIYSRRRGEMGAKLAAAYAGTCVVDKFPRLWGMTRYCALRAAGRRGRIIEYKAPAPGMAAATAR